jgi:hypothetical protein
MTKKEKPLSVPIKCKTKDTLPLAELVEMAFQPDNFKVFPVEAKEKLKTSIIVNGIFAPVLIWEEKRKILDGHHRVRVFHEMTEEGIQIPEQIPVVMVSAKDEKDAAKKLLLLNSRYAQITQEGFDQFLEINEIGDEVFVEIDIPDVEEITLEPDEDIKKDDDRQPNPEYEQFKCGVIGGAVRSEDARFFRAALEHCEDGSLLDSFSKFVEVIRNSAYFVDVTTGEDER